MNIRNFIDLLLQYRDADVNYADDPVLRKDLEIGHNELVDHLTSILNEKTSEEIEDGLAYIDALKEKFEAEEARNSQGIDDYRDSREDLCEKFEADLLRVRAKLSALEEYRAVIVNGRVKGNTNG